MTILKDGAFGQDLSRHLYQNGYNDGQFVEFKFEVDDNWQPHYIVSYAKNTFEGVGGIWSSTRSSWSSIATATPKVTEHKLGEEPTWS